MVVHTVEGYPTVEANRWNEAHIFMLIPVGCRRGTCGADVVLSMNSYVHTNTIM